MTYDIELRTFSMNAIAEELERYLEKIIQTLYSILFTNVVFPASGYTIILIKKVTT